MPTNVTPEYLAAEIRYNEANIIGEKIKYLKEMLSTVPKHKGTETLRKNLHQRLVKLKQMQQKEKKRRKGGYSIAVPKIGFQIVIIGFTNTGKSTLLKKLTNATPKIASYVYTTKKPEVGMLEYGGAQLQLVEIPALKANAAQEQAELLSIVHAADGIILIRSDKKQEQALKKELKVFNIKKPTLIIDKFKELSPKQIFDFFKLIRVYTKEPGEQVDRKRPLVLRKGSTVSNAAREVHKDFYKKLKYARVWGSTKFAGQRVEKSYKLKDKDIVEFHI